MIYLYKDIPDNLEENGIALTDFVTRPEINRMLNGTFQFYGVYKLDGQGSNEIKNHSFIKAQDPDGNYQYFRIEDNDKKSSDQIIINALHIGYMANDNYVEDSYTPNGNGTSIMKSLQENLSFKQRFQYTSNIKTMHQFTANNVNPIDAIMGSNNGQQNLVGVTAGELDMDNFFLNLKERIGTDRGYRLDFGVNILAIQEKVKNSTFYNSLHLIGGTPDDVEYDEDQAPVEFKYLEIKGVTDKTRRIRKRENAECKTVEDLKKWGQSLFDVDRVHEPTITHEVDMVLLEQYEEYKEIYQHIDKLSFGDTVYIHVAKMGIDIQERMIEYTWLPPFSKDMKGKYKQVVLGNELQKYSASVTSTIQQVKNDVIKKTSALQEAIISASEWITGTKGGYVRFRPKNEPSEILIMDKPTTAEAKKVWRWNLGGLGFSNNGVNGPFETAITQNGEIVANFIKVGVIQADVFENSFNGTGDTLKLVQGLLQIWNNSRKIMELTKKGLEFWRGDESLGHIGTTAKYPRWLSQDDETSDRALYIEGMGADFISLVTENEEGLFIPKTGLGQPISLFSKTAIDIYLLNGTGLTLQNGKALINGDLQVTGDISSANWGTGGGSGSGNLGSREDYAKNMITDLFNADLDKIYASYLQFGRIKSWGIDNRQSFDELNEIIRGQGVSPTFFWAYEYGEGYNPSTSFLNHFYVDNSLTVQQECRRTAAWVKETSLTSGSLAWYDAMYPYYTSPPDKQAIGNAYMAETKPGMIARVMLQGTAAATWAMFDPEALKGSVNGVQDYSDPFLHQMEAIKSWKRPQTYIKPMNQYVIMSEFGWRNSPISGGMEFHNGIDLSSGGNSSIYASNGGIVVTAGANYFDWFGNYVVIKHPDGLYTGYAHLSRIDVVVGQEVTQGQQIGVEGETGPVTGPHLHFQFMKTYANGWPIGGNDDFINPRNYVTF